MKRFAVSAMFAGCLFVGALGMADAANATEINVGPNGAGITSVDGGGIMVGPDGLRVWVPSGTSRYDGRYSDERFGNQYDGRYGHSFDPRYGMRAGVTNPCYPDYCVR